MIEPGTSLHDWYQRGLMTPQDEDLGADMYEFTIDYLDRAGYEHYEISNWAKRDEENQFRCMHNMQYWLNQPYIGIGAGAHGYINTIRTENVSGIENYITRMRKRGEFRVGLPETPATIRTTKIDDITQMKDSMWLALRLVKDGVSLDRFERSFGKSVLEVFKEQVEELLHLGLIEWGGLKQSNLKLTRRGLMVANQVFLRFI
jgi:oxygen-independent coproporphyrinogen-3 oxidase